MGDAGDQILLGYIQKIDAQGATSYVHNVIISGAPQDTEASDMAFTAYLSTSATWAETNVITARSTGAGGGTVSLQASRTIQENAEITAGNEGLIYIWGETSNSVLDEDFRIIVEVWSNGFTSFVADTS